MSAATRRALLRDKIERTVTGALTGVEAAVPWTAPVEVYGIRWPEVRGEGSKAAWRQAVKAANRGWS